MIRAKLEDNKARNNFYKDVKKSEGRPKIRLGPNVTKTVMRSYTDFELWHRGKVVGSLAVSKKTGLCAVYLLPAFRGKGLAQQLYEYALKDLSYLRSDLLLTKGSNLIWCALWHTHKVQLNVAGHRVDIVGWERLSSFWWPIVLTDSGRRSLRWLRKHFKQADDSYFEVGEPNGLVESPE